MFEAMRFFSLLSMKPSPVPALESLSSLGEGDALERLPVFCLYKPDGEFRLLGVIGSSTLLKFYSFGY